MSLRLNEAQFAALSGKTAKKTEKKQVAIAGGYRSKWSGTVIVGNKTCRFRSLWERNYACYLEWLKRNKQIYDWEFEPKKFDFPMIYKTTPFAYLVDFKVWLSAEKYEWHEVKGVMNPKSVKRIKRFEKHFPNEGKIVVIGKEWFKQNGANFAKLLPGWKRLSEINR